MLACAQVYNHHCIDGLPAKARALRDAAVYGLRQREALAWALELLGFRDVCVKARCGCIMGGSTIAQAHPGCSLAAQLAILAAASHAAAPRWRRRSLDAPPCPGAPRYCAAWLGASPLAARRRSPGPWFHQQPPRCEALRPQ